MRVIQEKLLFNIAVSNLSSDRPFPMRVNNLDVVDYDKNRILARNENTTIEFRRDEIGNIFKPQLSNFTRSFFINNRWV